MRGTAGRRRGRPHRIDSSIGCRRLRPNAKGRLLLERSSDIGWAAQAAEDAARTPMIE